MGRAVKNKFPGEPSTHVLTPQGLRTQTEPPKNGRWVGGFGQTGDRIHRAVVWSKTEMSASIITVVPPSR